MFVKFDIVDMNDAQAKDHPAYVLATEVVAILPKRIDMALKPGVPKDPHHIPRYLEVTVIAVRTGTQFVTRATVEECHQKVEEAALGLVRVK